MSWLDILGNVAGWVGDNAGTLAGAGLAAGGIAAAPFTGGTSLGLTAAGAGLIGANLARQGAEGQADAATKAAQIQADQNQQGLQFQRNALAQQQQNAQPWMQAGQGAMGQIQQLNNTPNFNMSDFQQDPGYAFRLSEGMRAVQQSAAARGISGPGMAKDISDYAQQSASQEYGNAFQRYQDQRQQRLSSLGQVAGLGGNASMGYGQGIQNAGNNASNLAMNTGQAMAGGITGAANANAAGMMGAANALSSGVSGAINYNQSNNLLNALRPKQDSTTDMSHMFDMSGTGEGNIPTQFGNSLNVGDRGQYGYMNQNGPLPPHPGTYGNYSPYTYPGSYGPPINGLRY